MSNPVTINSPALRLFGTAYAAYAMQIVDAVNASPYLQGEIGVRLQFPRVGR